MGEGLRNEINESISGKEKTNTIQQEISIMTNSDKKELVQFIKEKSDTSLNGLEKELNKENMTLINEFAKKMIVDNKLNPEDQILLFNALADNLSADFPEISKTLKIFGGINDMTGKITEDIVFKRLNEMQSNFINKGYFINTDRITTGEDLIMKIEGEKRPNKVINLVFGNDVNVSTLSPSIVLNDKTYKKFGFNIGNTSVVNKGEIKNFIEEGYKKGRYTTEQLQTFDLDNIAEATVNHETSHALMSRYNFPDRKELDLKAGKDWIIPGVNFIPNNTVQIDEFIAHSIGQATDNFEIMTNVYSALEDLQNQQTFDIKYEVGKKKGDYSLLRSLILEELKDIFKSKGVEQFDSYIVKKISPIYNEQIGVQKEYKKLIELGKKDTAKVLANKWVKEGKGTKLTAEFNPIVGDVLKMLTPSDYQKIKERCLNQAKVYINQIKETYGK